MPYLVIDRPPGEEAGEQEEPSRFDGSTAKGDAVRFAEDLVAEYRELGYRVRRHGMQWICEQSRRQPARRVEVVPIPDELRAA